ncbi:hypothetical protein SAMN05216207_103643 [Pseudonocardia ammonioxydans]|uniref:Uncharacterized protein n=1 Tax=Pseudonocardia ammonioxydans TaxID=260086 RepID=A0A1I5F9Z4_PSUAM|nr:hypothetical protein [Pseudonocardia ammonioxydans]SFO20588.1 hypothetical protein SAMN05216207_103643 [Pseudonocardia ammonioxydans]
MSADPPSNRPTVRGARRAMIVAVVVSLVLAAVLGIAALLTGEFGELEGRILLSTLVVAAFGTTALCHLAVVTRRVRVVGYAGLAASAVAAAVALVLVWADEAFRSSDLTTDVLLLCTIAAVALAHTNLVLLLAGRAHPAIRAGLVGTLAAIALVAVLLATLVLTDGEIGDGSWFWRLLGVAGIVDALGTIALPVLALLVRPPAPAPVSAPSPDSVRVVLDLPPDLAARLDAHAGDRSREEAARDVLHRGLP